jgi:hypothetical protein
VKSWSLAEQVQFQWRGHAFPHEISGVRLTEHVHRFASSAAADTVQTRLSQNSAYLSVDY